MSKRESDQLQEDSSENKDPPKLCRSASTQLWQSILALDQEWTANWSVCANKESTLSKFRPLMKLLEISFHGVLWLTGTVIAFLLAHRVQDIEIVVNLFFLLIFDLIVVGVTKVLFRRARPSHNRMDMFATVSVDLFSFPSGHATRAAMISVFFIERVELATRFAPAVIGFCVCVGLSRVLLGRHHVMDVVFGFVIGMLEYIVYLQFWIPGSVLVKWLEDYFGHIHL
ncbi:hypothetical protein BaRGS_00011784 [Batillaria attramentaria]|uniref:Phosphatidic acid phosphatase type 2/haloperoxidase domain-containing protein n=1 Tax=Batillaria attramentaria TaxID=370345 RepID=A0ABD0LC92_9CAEN